MIGAADDTVSHRIASHRQPLMSEATVTAGRETCAGIESVARRCGGRKEEGVLEYSRRAEGADGRKEYGVLDYSRQKAGCGGRKEEGRTAPPTTKRFSTSR